ncbi:MAG: MFS transporter [Pseudomonadota bacterium]
MVGVVRPDRRVQAFWLLVATRFGLGAGEAVIYPGTIHVGGVAFTERRRGLAMAISQEGSKIGPAIGAPLAGFLIATYGWREMFFIVGLGALVWLIPWFLIAPSRSEDVAKDRAAFGLAECGALLKKRVVWGLMIGHFGVLYVVYVYITWLPGYLVLARASRSSRPACIRPCPSSPRALRRCWGDGSAITSSPRDIR